MAGRSTSEYHVCLQEVISLSAGHSFLSSTAVDPHASCSSTFELVRRALDEILSKRQLAEDTSSARYYAALLRLAYLLLSDPKTELGKQMGVLVATLAMFFTYCPSQSQRPSQRGVVRVAAESVAGPSTATSGGGEKGTYRPPHLRGSTGSRGGSSSPAGGGSDDDRWRAREGASWRKGSGNDGAGGSGAESRSGLSSDSEMSDSDGALGLDQDKTKSSKARLAALLCLQAIARSDPKSLHSHWALLLPTRDVLQARPYQPTLFTPLLFDPVPKVRVAAATAVSLMLEGPSKAYLQVAEFKQGSRASPFTSLSSTLGEIAVQLHTGLLHLIRAEADTSILVPVLKALSLLVAATPYHRLPIDLLPGVLRTIHHRFGNLSSTISVSTTTPLTASAIVCIGAALSATPPSPAVASLLTVDTVAGNQAEGPVCLTRDLIYCTRPSVNPLVAIEAFQALRSGAQNYPTAIGPHWLALSDAIGAVLRAEETSLGGVSMERGSAKYSPRRRSSGGASPRHGGQPLAASVPAGGGLDEKLTQSAVKLLDELLRSASGFRETADEGAADEPHVRQPLSLGQSLPSTSGTCPPPVVSSGQPGADGAPGGVSSGVDGLAEWTDALESHLPVALSHSSAVVRGAGFTCLAGITEDVMCSLSDTWQRSILTQTVSATGYHEPAGVRSSACRALGVMAAYPPVVNRPERMGAALEALTSAASPSTPSAQVRVVGAWALANVCGAMRKNAESTATGDLRRGEAELASLASCMLRAASDGDKVRANAVRGLGHLAAFARFDFPRPPLTRSAARNPQPSTSAPAGQWLESLVQTLISCLTAGNAKVQWNVCHAAACLFRNDTASLSAAAWAEALLTALLPLLRNSPNFKIRIHAASALSAPSSRRVFGGMLTDVAQGLCEALDGLDSAHGESPTDYKYKPALESQLRSALHAVKGMALPGELNDLSQQLSRLRV